MITDAELECAAAADSAALVAAARSAEEALACHRAALAALTEGWRSETGSAATNLAQEQCAEATDIVAALHRAAAELTVLRDGWAEDLTGEVGPAGVQDGRPPGQPLVETSSRELGDPVPAPPEPLPVGDFSTGTWAGEPTAGTWAGPWAAAPTPAPPPWPSGGSAPAFPDLGRALVGLVAQIAQTLGSYSDIPGTSSAEGGADKPSADAAPEPPPPHRGQPPLQPGDGPHPGSPDGPHPGSPDGTVPDIAVPESVPPAQIPRQAPELLAAERPNDPGPPLNPVPPPVSAAAPEPSPPSAVPAGPAPAPTADTKTPCEIAADELAMVGE